MPSFPIGMSLSFNGIYFFLVLLDVDFDEEDVDVEDFDELVEVDFDGLEVVVFDVLVLFAELDEDDFFI
ncbi:hypothetical protein D3C84_1028540 [compost metagenome]